MHIYFRRIMKTFIITCAFFIFIVSGNINAFAETIDKEEVGQNIEEIYNIRNEALVLGSPKMLPQYFDTSQTYGKWALEHEVRRVKYLKDWSSNRGIKFTKIESMVRVRHATKNGNHIKVVLEESLRFDYIYPEDERPETNSFGVGLRHVANLKMMSDGKYAIYNDWYTDCFQDALAAYTGTIPVSSNINNQNMLLYQIKLSGTYNRENAVKYADKYCGAAWGSGNDYKYNKRYADYTGIGGDCTNFASQVLGDKEGGALRQGGGWNYNYSKFGRGEGSRAWVNTDAFKGYLLYSGKGSVIKRGSFNELTKKTTEDEGGAIGKLEVGDLVCYAKKNDIDHFAVVTAFDKHGYPLVNSHTTDRYHVPWDLGWNDSIINFYLIHIRD